MNEDESIVVNLTLDSTNETLVTSLLPYLQHKYQHGDAKAAISIMSDLFNGMVKDHAISRILSNEKLALYIVEDLMQNKLTFMFYPYELSENAMKEIEDNQ